jgi:hypothetical protein
MYLKLFCFIIIVLFLNCSEPKYIVVNKVSNEIYDNCIVELRPINLSAKINNYKTTLIQCDKWQIRDTLIMTDEEFANLNKDRFKNFFYIFF